MVSGNGAVMTTIDELTKVAPWTERLRARVARVIGLKADYPAPDDHDTTVGLLDATWNRWTKAFDPQSSTRFEVYSDVEEMERTIDEVAASLQILADEAVNSEGGSQEPFRVVFQRGGSVRTQTIVEDMLERTKLKEKIVGVARDALLYGDNFQQIVVNSGMDISRLMFMPPRSMFRNEDPQGLLMDGTETGSWAFEQKEIGSDTFLAGFYPWQIEHLRWNRSGASPYGRSLLATARVSWQKLKAMEEAMCANWLTRAFARLMFIVDTSGMSRKESEAFVRKFKRDLMMQKISSGVVGKDELSVVKDIFIGTGYREFGGKVYPGLGDVKVLDTSSTAFSNLDPLLYYRDKIMASLLVPKAYLGIEKDINSKATLAYEDRRFARTVRRVQAMLSELVSHLIIVQLILEGINPGSVKYLIDWPNPSRRDELEQSQILHNQAQAAKVLADLGVVDAEFVATQIMNLRPDQWAEMYKRIEKANAQKQEEALALAAAQPNQPPVPAGGNGNGRQPVPAGNASDTNA